MGDERRGEEASEAEAEEDDDEDEAAARLITGGEVSPGRQQLLAIRRSLFDHRKLPGWDFLAKVHEGREPLRAHLLMCMLQCMCVARA